ncbi:MAG: hypothetical protein BroJett014_05460 [Planctomycetota bacterium]|nr:MAG: hypothetical protein BroJett014_05460 [Planctomycetota bacterium]
MARANSLYALSDRPPRSKREMYMNSIARILAATDLSDNSMAALHTSVLLAELYQAELHVVTVIPARQGNTEDLLGKARKTIEVRAADELAKLCARLKKSPVNVQTRVVTGEVVPTVLQLAHDLKIDLTVAGTRGMGSKDLGSIGGVAERLAHAAATDVLLVRPDHSDLFNHICVAVDFSELSVMALKRAAEIARLMKVKELKLLHVLHLPDEYWLTGLSEKESLAKLSGFARQHMQEAVAGAGLKSLKTVECYEEGKPAETLARMAVANKADLLVMGSHGGTAASSAVVGSVAAKTIRAIPASLWIETDPKFKLGFLRALGKLMGLVSD